MLCGDAATEQVLAFNLVVGPAITGAPGGKGRKGRKERYLLAGCCPHIQGPASSLWARPGVLGSQGWRQSPQLALPSVEGSVSWFTSPVI